MGTTKAYDDLVEGFRAKISGNISSVKMTTEECQAEIAAIQDGAKSSFEREEGNKGGVSEIVNKAIPMLAEAGGIQVKKRGRPKGSKNKPKV